MPDVMASPAEPAEVLAPDGQSPATEAPASPPVDAPDGPPPSPASEVTESATPAESAATATPPPFEPPDGEPFAFRVDGREVTIPGVRAVGDYILVPKDAWHSQLRPQFLGDRSAWRNEKAALERKIAEGQTAPEVVARAEALIGRVRELIADPDKFADFVADHQRNAPMLMLQAEKDMLSRQLQERQQRESAAAEQQAIADAVPELQQSLGHATEAYLAETGASTLPIELQVQIVKDLWEDRERFFPRVNGQYGFDEETFRRLADRAVRWAKSAQATAAAQQQAAVTNTAATAPTPAGKRPAPSSAPAAPRAPQAPRAAPGTTPGPVRDHTNDRDKWDEWFKKF